MTFKKQGKVSEESRMRAGGGATAEGGRAGRPAPGASAPPGVRWRRLPPGGEASTPAAGCGDAVRMRCRQAQAVSTLGGQPCGRSRRRPSPRTHAAARGGGGRRWGGLTTSRFRQDADSRPQVHCQSITSQSRRAPCCFQPPQKTG